MRRPTCTGVVGVLLLIIACTCLVNALFFANLVTASADFNQLRYQAACIGCAYICCMNGMCTWYVNTDVHKPRQHLRLTLMLLLVISFVAIAVTCYFFVIEYTDSKLGKITKLNQLFTDGDLLFFLFTKIICGIILLLLLVTIIILGIITFKRWRKHRKNARRASANPDPAAPAAPGAPAAR